MEDEDFDESLTKNILNSNSSSNTNVKEIANDQEKRKILRDIELKILKYIDDLENGKIRRQTNMSLLQQAEEYRAQLIEEVIFSFTFFCSI